MSPRPSPSAGECARLPRHEASPQRTSVPHSEEEPHETWGCGGTAGPWNRILSHAAHDVVRLLDWGRVSEGESRGLPGATSRPDHRPPSSATARPPQDRWCPERSCGRGCESPTDVSPWRPLLGATVTLRTPPPPPVAGPGGRGAPPPPHPPGPGGREAPPPLHPPGPYH